MKNMLKEILNESIEALNKADSLEELENLKVKVLGRKGSLTSILRGMKDLSKEERPMMGKYANEIREKIENSLAEKEKILQEKRKEFLLERERIDVTMPGKKAERGNVHPLTKTINEVKSVFIGLGYDVVDGPEVELTYYNFDALNAPKFHPSRDYQDTFYINPEIVLRTQTSPMQARTMEKNAPPLKIIAPGRVYRNDNLDATHSPLFTQMEGLAVGKGISFGDLKGTLTTFCKAIFGEEREVRFRPHNFPFTEPSAEVDISCIVCGGKGCRVCSDTGWIEILGAGMVHPNVLAMAGYDPNEVSGFAFGLGIERICMLKYGMNDIRAFYENDIRFLEQFK